MSIKQEVLEEVTSVPDPAPPMHTPVDPKSVLVTSVLQNNLVSVQMVPSVAPELTNIHGKIGRGKKSIQFFYENKNESPAFPPVYVDNNDEVKAVAALVAEKAEEFKRRSGKLSGVNGPPQYYTVAARARYPSNFPVASV